MIKKKNKIVLFALVVISIFSTFPLSGCFIDSDEDIVKKNTAKLIEVIQKDDHEGIKALFAPNKIADLENFDKSIDDLLAYIDGDYVSSKNKGTGTFGDIHYGRVIKYQDMSNDVTTTTGIIRFGIIWYVEDNGEAGNVGIWSLYVLKYDDDPNKEYSYRGDGLGTIGISIGKIEPEILD